MREEGTKELSSVTQFVDGVCAFYDVKHASEVTQSRKASLFEAGRLWHSVITVGW
jgi:hypothetical protein